MKKRKTNLLDEMQRGKLYQMEEIGENICFWGLLAAIAIQLVLGCELRQVLGEMIVFALLCIYLLVAAIWRGIWTNAIAPTRKNNAIAGAAAAAVIGAFSAIRAFAVLKQAFSWGKIGTIALSMALAFLLCFAALEACRRLYQKRRKALDGENEGEEHEVL